MKRMLLVIAAAAGIALVAPETAKAQYFGPQPGYGGLSVGLTYNVPVYGYRPIYAPGYPVYPRVSRGHYDVQPGHFHGYRYVPPHVDYHHRGHYHAVNPYTGRISPFPHQHRHR